MTASMRCRVRRTAGVLAACLLGVAQLEAATVHVSTAGNDGNNGQTWATAKKTVQAGLNAAASGDQVWVAAGTYVENITLKSEVGLYGGFAGTGTETDLVQRNWAVNVTVLDGNQAGSVVTAPLGATATTRIDGFTIRNGGGTPQSGGSPDGGGISCSASSPTIANNTITSNSAASGGGIFCQESSPAIIGNTIRGNSGGGGAGIYCAWYAAPTILCNTISGNTSHGTGGGIGCNSSSPTIAGNIIIGNDGAAGGGGIFCTSSSPTILNNTIAGNSAIAGGGIRCSGSSPAIANTIIAFNSSGIYASSGSALSLHSNCVYGNLSSNYSGLADPTGSNGNVSVDPRLAPLQYGNAHLQPDSPCVDAGDDGVPQPGGVDVDGQARSMGAHTDIGADESDGTTWTVQPNSIVRVSPGGNDSNDGSSWTLAKRSVQAGIDAAAASGGDVWVKAGTYAERITLRNFAHVYGGFGGTESSRSARDWRGNVTILDGNQGGVVVTAGRIGQGLSTIDGFTIRHGSGGVRCLGACPTISHNIIVANTDSGIGCYAESSPAILDNTITGNSASREGGGIFCAQGSSPRIINNTITANVAGSYGGGLYCVQGSSPVVANTIMSFNSSGIYNTGSGTPLLRYTCVYGNTAYDFSGLADPTGTNGNISADPRFVRLPNDGGDGWGDIPATPGVDEGANDDYGDLRLLPSSPCIDAGNNADVPADPADLDGDGNTTEPLPFDLAGGVRFADDPATADTGAGTAPIVDIGAYEYHCGDVSGDGHVDVMDLLDLAGAWGTAAGDSAYNATCDFNSDGSVDVIDLLMLARNWGT